MAARSSIEREPEIRAAVDQALAEGATIDQIVARLRDVGSTVSRSAVGRYAADYREIADRQRDMKAVATAFAGEFGEAGDNQTRLMVQLVTTVMTRAAMDYANNDEVTLDTKELMELGRAVQSITSAAKINTDRDAKVREEARKQALIDAAVTGEKAARAAGASEEAAARVRRDILGVVA